MCVPVLSRVTSNRFEDLPKKDELDGGWALPNWGERAWHRGSPHSPGKGWKHTISPVFHHFLHLVLSKLPGPANQVSRFFSEVASQITSFHRWAADTGGITGQYFK